MNQSKLIGTIHGCQEYNKMRNATSVFQVDNWFEIDGK